MDKIQQEIENLDILDGELPMELDDFAKLLWNSINDDMVAVLPEKIMFSGTNSYMEKDPFTLYKYIFFMHYFNLLMIHVLGHKISSFRSFVKKNATDKNMKDFFTKSDSLDKIISKNEQNIRILNAIIRTYISKLMENGTSTQRLDSSLSMHYLNAVSTVVPNIRKNIDMRKHIIPVVIEDVSVLGKIKRLFRK
jgi:hypothetical protein